MANYIFLIVFIVLAILVMLVAIVLDRQAEIKAKQFISCYSTSILGEVQTRGLSPLFKRLDSTSLERERLYLHHCHATPLSISSVWFATERLLIDKTFARLG